jgi:hypothetical protein
MVANATKPQVVVPAVRMRDRARQAHDEYFRFSISFSAMTRGRENQPRSALHQKG